MTKPSFKLFFTSLIGFIFLWLFVALIHTTDADVNGIQGLAAANILVSVTVFSVLFVLPALVPIIGFLQNRLRGYSIGLSIVSGLIGLLIAGMGSTATTPDSWFISIGGMTLICAIFFGAATLPLVLVLREVNK